jgi:hypothetical protein
MIQHGVYHKNMRILYRGENSLSNVQDCSFECSTRAYSIKIFPGFTEVACSRNIEIGEGQTVFFHCKGNLESHVDDTLQLNFFAFRENRLPFFVHVVNTNEPMKMKLVVILNPRRDQHGKVHAACALDINLTSDVSFTFQASTLFNLYFNQLLLLHSSMSLYRLYQCNMSI